MKRIVILGSTGSIGVQTLQVVERFPERLQVLGIAGRRQDELARQAAAYHVGTVALGDEAQPEAPFPSGCRVLTGPSALVDLATWPDADLVVMATVGRAGLLATLAALQAGKRVLLANKEVLVMAGALARELAAAHGGALVPVDSEHSALWQCLVGEDPAAVQELILTASGGALRNQPVEALADVTPAQALNHPTWRMGAKVTIDSASLMNKGLEVIEARWLFDLPYERIRVVLHPTSVVHSLVSFVDGAIKAQLGIADMRLPIQYALSYPERWPEEALRTDVLRLGDLHFAEPDWSRYPCLTLAIEAGRRGGTYPAALSGADEAAVELFMAGAIRFTDIPMLVERVLEEHQSGAATDLESILAADRWARERCATLAAR